MGYLHAALLWAVTAYCLLLTAYCLLPTAHCLLLTALRQRFYDDVEAERARLLHPELEVNQNRLAIRQLRSRRDCARRQRRVITTADTLSRRRLQRCRGHCDSAWRRAGPAGRTRHCVAH